MRPLGHICCWLIAASALPGCADSATPIARQQQPVSIADDPDPVQPERLAVKHLPNAIRLHERVISGGLPEGEQAFAELHTLGIKTVISVDGAKPDAAVPGRRRAGDVRA